MTDPLHFKYKKSAYNMPNCSSSYATITLSEIEIHKRQEMSEQEEPAMTEFINVLLIGYTVLQAVMYIALAVREDREAKEHS